MFLGKSTLFGLLKVDEFRNHFMDDHFVNLGEEVVLTLL